ncbi:MAG: hypothetical protein RSC08_00660, partial [Oscillospiraceae bacterium]
MNKLLALILTAAMAITLLPTQALALDYNGDYSISNEYVSYTINAKTGGFSIDTLTGHPQKQFDNNIPLLFKDSPANSNGTSFTTVRIGEKDYIFGQDYGWFGIESKLYTPVISNEGRLITVRWDIKGYSVVQEVALSIDPNNDLCGNVGISYKITNNSNAVGQVGVRVLLDNALDSKADAPYVMAGIRNAPSIVEEEFSAAASTMPQQVRYVDSLSAPSKIAYALLKGWSNTEDTVADRVVVGHWANMANTRYNYTPDPSCDFSNYSNAYRIPDTATCFYWSQKDLAAGATRTTELLYGIGNFTKELTDTHVNLEMVTGQVLLDNTGKAYQNGGIFEVTVTINNNVPGSRDIDKNALLTLTLDDGMSFVDGQGSTAQEFLKTFDKGIKKGEEEPFKVHVKAASQAQVTSKRISAALTGAEVVDASTNKLVEYAASRYVLLPSVGGMVPDVQMTQISPEIVYKDGEKSLTISGKMKAFEALRGSVGWDMYVVSVADPAAKYLVTKDKIAFTDDSYETMSFSFTKDIAIGKYNIVFEFTDQTLQKSFGKSLTATATFEASDNPIYRSKSYGLAALTRHKHDSVISYDWLTFANEGALNKFLEGKTPATGLGGYTVKFGDDCEVLLTVRGRLLQLEDENKKPYLQANPANGDVTLNNILTYTGTIPLDMRTEDSTADINGDGTIKVINSINIWHNKWKFEAEKGTKYTLDMDALDDKVSSLDLQFVGAGSMLQKIGGFLIDLKFGQLSKDDELYGISFGGQITVPISTSKKEDPATDAGSGGTTPPPSTGSAGDGTGGDEEDGGDGAAIRAEITDILYGGGGDREVGFVGIDTTISVSMPEDVLGSLVQNVGGMEASLTINTIKKMFKIEMGVDMKIISCEGVIAFKQVPIQGIPVIVPDELGFKMAGFSLPIVPPYVTMTGLGGGVSDLADSMSDELEGLPPITLHLYTQLALIEVLRGDFTLDINLSGMDLAGELKLLADTEGKIMRIQGGLSARWLTPFYINAFGKVDLIDGMVKGGVSITISDKYFYGYIFAVICIPNSVPLLGGMELAGVEAAVSSDFIGANVKIIGITAGFIYYWDGTFDFGGAIDLSQRGGAVKKVEEHYYDEDGKRVDYVGLYGTNFRRLASTKVESYRADGTKTITKNFDPSTEDALLLEIPFTGASTPTTDQVTLTDPKGKKIPLVPSDGKGGGNFLVQDLGNGKKSMYISIIDKTQLIKGDWSLTVTTTGVEGLTDFAADGVDTIPVVSGVTFTHSAANSKKLTVNWTTDVSGKAPGTLDLYLTKNPKALEDLHSADTASDKALSDIVAHIELTPAASGTKEIDIPDSYENGEYYVVATLSQSQGGMSTAISTEKFTFVNDKLPKAATAAALTYAGNGELELKVTDPADKDYTHYEVAVLDGAGQTVPGSEASFAVGAPILLGTTYDLSQQSAKVSALAAETGGTVTEPPRKAEKVNYLKAGETYKVKVTTYKEAEGQIYFSAGTVVTAPLVMPAVALPTLKSVEANVKANTADATDAKSVKTDAFKATYHFDTPVAFYTIIDGDSSRMGDDKEVYRKDWTVETTLEDGDHFIDFKAFTKQGDWVTGADAESKVPNARFGYNVDTMAPVLSFAEESAASIDDKTNPTETQVSTQTVPMDASGNITLKGITEADAKLLFDGKADGIVQNKDGSFIITRKMDLTQVYRQCSLTATDKAGNKTTVMVNVINSAIAAFDSLKLYAEAMQDATKPGELKSIELSVGTSVALSTFGVKTAKETAIDPSKISWNVLYEKNIISMENGVITALSPGETAIRASYDTILYSDAADAKLTGALSDAVKIVVKD